MCFFSERGIDKLCPDRRVCQVCRRYGRSQTDIVEVINPLEQRQPRVLLVVAQLLVRGQLHYRLQSRFNVPPEAAHLSESVEQQGQAPQVQVEPGVSQGLRATVGEHQPGIEPEQTGLRFGALAECP
ncbi:hypothetical protein [Rhodoferax antarcticus]|uniref:hypothetical protein n=1 Tax=Rhodoferax antarcticus TaxID=81479 RepID=UPI0022243C34|nr:hypothetical protein [Rhodoferax antarcticus]MCW2311496.1 hypothetical protein [Rhodoferax antarcticus]